MFYLQYFRNLLQAVGSETLEKVGVESVAGKWGDNPAPVRHTSCTVGVTCVNSLTELVQQHHQSVSQHINHVWVTLIWKYVAKTGHSLFLFTRNIKSKIVALYHPKIRSFARFQPRL